MYARLLSLYQRGAIAQPSLDAAVAKGWITGDEKVAIMNAA